MHCVNDRIIKISSFCTLLYQNLNDCLVFPFSFCLIWKHFLVKYSGYFAWDLHTLLDRGNLCHSDVWYILCFVCWEFLCLQLLGIFVQHFWYLVLVSQFFCHFYSHLFVFGICTLCLLAVVTFCLFSVFLACLPFLQLVCGSSLYRPFLYSAKLN